MHCFRSIMPNVVCIMAAVTGKLFVPWTLMHNISLLPIIRGTYVGALVSVRTIPLCSALHTEQPLSVRHAYLAYFPQVSSCTPYTRAHEGLGRQRPLLPPACHDPMPVQLFELCRAGYATSWNCRTIIVTADDFRLAVAAIWLCFFYISHVHRLKW